MALVGPARAIRVRVEVRVPDFLATLEALEPVHDVRQRHLVRGFVLRVLLVRFLPVKGHGPHLL